MTKYVLKENVFFNELKEAIGPDNIFWEEGVLASYIGTACHGKLPAMPDFVVVPRNMADVISILRVANKHKIPLTPFINGTFEPSTVPYAGGILVDFGCMNRIHEIRPDDGYAVVEPGVPVGMLSQKLGEHKFRCALGSYPPWIPVMNYTLRSNTTYRTSIDDDVIGLEVILPDGTVVRTGSAALPDGEWHSAYGPFPDLHGLFLCAHGTLGLITKLALRIYPRNEAQALPIAAFDDYATSMEYSLRLARANMAEHIIIWHWKLIVGLNETETEIRKIKKLSDIPKEITIGDIGDTPPEGVYYNYVTVQMSGFKEEMQTREKVCAKLAKELGGYSYSLDDFGKKFPGTVSTWRRAYLDNIPMMGQQRYRSIYGVPGSLVVFLSPTQAVRYERAIRKKLIGANMPFRYYSHLYDQGRSVFIRTGMGVADPKDKKSVEKFKQLQLDIYNWAAEKYKAVPARLVHIEAASELLKRMGGYTELWRRIKRVVDPNNIMNPGFFDLIMGSPKIEEENQDD